MSAAHTHNIDLQTIRILYARTVYRYDIILYGVDRIGVLYLKPIHARIIIIIDVCIYHGIIYHERVTAKRNFVVVLRACCGRVHAIMCYLPKHINII